MNKNANPKKPKPTTGFAFSGTWNNGGVGWNMPPYLNGNNSRKYPSRYKTGEMEACFLPHERMYLCRVTITPVKDKLGRYITRKPYRKEPPNANP